MSTHFDTLIKGGTALLSLDSGDLVEEEIDIGILDGKIAEIGSLRRASALSTFSAKHLHVLPGLIDTQVHFREPGASHKEDISTGSRSALLGGLTAFFEMPNTYPPTVTAHALEDKIQKAKDRSYCDFAFYIGAWANNVDQLDQLARHPHCPGIKIFMGSSTGTLLLADEHKIAQVLASTKAPIAVHSEDEERLKQRKPLAKRGEVHLHPVWRDPECALLSTQKIVAICKKYQRRVHILHVTTEEEVQFLLQNKEWATMEVTPQHLTLKAPDCYEQLGTRAQMNPPIREERHQKALWRSVKLGLATTIGSDHAPHTLEEKQKIYPDSPAGMPGTQTLLPLMLDHVNHGRLSLKRLTNLLATNPHRLFNMQNQGLLKKGFKANLTLIDINQKRKITKPWLASKCGWSPFENLEVKGWPFAVLLKGQWAMREDEILGPPKGEGVHFS